MSGPAEHYQAAIATIRNAVVDYREGLARIDREFDAACERIDNSIVDLNQYGAKTGRAQTDAKQRERHLRQQENAVTRQLATTDEKIAQANEGLAAATSGIRALATEKSTLEKQISDRWLIVSLYYYFAEESDEAKKRCRTLQSQLDSAASRKAALERTKGEFETIRRQEETRRAKLQATLDEIRWEIAALEKSRGLNQEQSRRLTEERQNADAHRQLRRANWLSNFANEWTKAVTNIERDGQGLRRRQPLVLDRRRRDVGRGCAREPSVRTNPHDPEIHARFAREQPRLVDPPLAHVRRAREARGFVDHQRERSTLGGHVAIGHHGCDRDREDREGAEDEGGAASEHGEFLERSARARQDTRRRA